MPDDHKSCVSGSYDVFERKRIIHSITSTPLNSAGARGQHRCNTRLGGWAQISTKRETEVSAYASYSATLPVAVACCGSRTNRHVSASEVNPWICQDSLQTIQSLVPVFWWLTLARRHYWGVGNWWEPVHRVLVALFGEKAVFDSRVLVGAIGTVGNPI